MSDADFGVVAEGEKAHRLYVKDVVRAHRLLWGYAAVLIVAETGTDSLNTEAIASLRSSTFKEVVDFLMPPEFWDKHVKPFEKKIIFLPLSDFA